MEKELVYYILIYASIRNVHASAEQVHTHERSRKGGDFQESKKQLQSVGIELTEIKISLQPHLAWIKDNRLLTKRWQQSGKRHQNQCQKEETVKMEYTDPGDKVSTQIGNTELTHIQNGNFTLNIFFKPSELLFRYKRATGMK